MPPDRCCGRCFPRGCRYCSEHGIAPPQLWLISLSKREEDLNSLSRSRNADRMRDMGADRPFGNLFLCAVAMKAIVSQQIVESPASPSWSNLLVGSQGLVAPVRTAT